MKNGVDPFCWLSCELILPEPVGPHVRDQIHRPDHRKKCNNTQHRFTEGALLPGADVPPDPSLHTMN